MLSPRTAHKMIHFFEKEAVASYKSYLDLIECGQIVNVPAPRLAIDYYDLPQDSRLSDMIREVLKDEERHAEANLFWGKMN